MKLNQLMLVAVTVTSALGCGDSGTGEDASEDVGSVQQREILACSNANPDVPTSAIKFDREMVIKNINIVNDACRTGWSAAGCGSSLGAWTFGKLMTTMSGSTDVNSATAKQFVANWLKLSLTTQTATSNGSPSVAPRPSMQEALIAPWLAASSCPAGATLDTCSLDLTRAPFRLLAIVNRIDMSGGQQYGTQSPGEFRMVFGALGKDVQGGIASGAPLQSTVILEYKFPTTRLASQWASLLHQLSAIDPSTSSASFAQTLQSVSDLIVGPGAQPGASNNGSSIGQIRTNEVVYDFHMGSDPNADPGQATWEMRQFRLASPSGTGVQLILAPVDQTPPTSANNTLPIRNFVINNQAALLSGSAVLPATLLGGSSISPSGVSATIWESPNPLTTTTAPSLTAFERALGRHNFGFATCNGCHYAATASQKSLFHIAPRDALTESTLSNFLSVGGGSDPLATINNAVPTTQFKVPDPINAGRTFVYNEPWRRACEIRRILRGVTTALSTPTGHM